MWRHSETDYFPFIEIFLTFIIAAKIFAQNAQHEIEKYDQKIQ